MLLHSTPFECEKSALEAVCCRRKSKVRSEEVEVTTTNKQTTERSENLFITFNNSTLLAENLPLQQQ